MRQQYTSIAAMQQDFNTIEGIAKNLPIVSKVYQPLRVLYDVFYIAAVQPGYVKEGKFIQRCSQNELELIAFLFKEKGYQTLITATSVYITTV